MKVDTALNRNREVTIVSKTNGWVKSIVLQYMMPRYSAIGFTNGRTLRLV